MSACTQRPAPTAYTWEKDEPCHCLGYAETSVVREKMLPTNRADRAAEIPGQETE